MSSGRRETSLGKFQYYISDLSVVLPPVLVGLGCRAGLTFALADCAVDVCLVRLSATSALIAAGPFASHLS